MKLNSAVFCIIIAFYVIYAAVEGDAQPAPQFKWSQCGGTSYFTVENFYITPSSAIPGQYLNATIEGSVKQPLDGGTIQMTFPLYTTSQKYCDPGHGRPCPVKTGPTKVSFSVRLPGAASMFAGQSVNGQIKLIDSNRVVRVCLKVAIPIEGRRSESANWIKEVDVLESLLSRYPNAQLRSPTDLFNLASYATKNKNTEEFQRTFLQRFLDILEPIDDPAAIGHIFKFNV